MIYNELHTNKLLECRSQPAEMVGDEQIFYVVHQVVVGNARWFHHGIVLADGLEDIEFGINSVRESIGKELPSNVWIQPVMIRSMMFFNEDVMEYIGSEDVVEKHSELLRNGSERNYLIYGIVNGDGICLLSASGRNAIEAAKSVAKHIESDGDSFLLLNVEIVSSFTDELGWRVEKAAGEIRLMLSADSEIIH